MRARPASAAARSVALLLVFLGAQMVMPPRADAAAQVELSTAALTFGPASPGPSQETKSVDVTNTGTEDVVVGSPSIRGADKGYFWASETCGGGSGGTTTLEPAEICSIDVTFAASTVGARSATMTIPNSAGPDLSVALSATTLLPDLDIDAPSAFGPTAVNGSSTRTVTVHSTGDLPLEVDGATVSGPNAGQFSIVGNDCALAATAPGNSCAITVRFLPTSSGAKSATLNVSSNAGADATVPLNGSTGTPTFTVAPGSINIPSTVVGTTSTASATVANTGVGTLDWNGATLSGANANQYQLNDTCEIAERISTEPCTVGVVFRPTSAGTKTATLTLEAAGQPDQVVSVSGVAVAATRIVSTSPASLTFGSQTIATSSSPQPITITNTGNSPLIISMDTFSIAPSTDYTVDYNCPLPLAPGEQCTLQAAFRPTAAGTRNATLSIISNGATKAVPMTGTGTAASAITINPGLRQFGNVAVGAFSGTINHTITNPGPGTLSLGTLSLGGPSANQFSIQSTTCGAALNASQSCTVSLRFAPGSMGLKTAHLVIPSSAGGSPHSIALTGIATRGYPDASTSSLDFGSAKVGVTTASQSVTVTNTGNAQMTVNTVTVDGADAADFAVVNTDCNGAVLPKDATCTADVRFTPTGPGPRTATLDIQHSAGADQTVALTGTGLRAVASLDSASLSFGDQPVGATSAPLTATLSNTGDAGLSLGTADLTGTDSGEFVVSGDTCSDAVIAPGDSCLLTVSVTPTSRGAKSATLTVPHSGPGGPASVILDATGSQAVASVNPTSRNFGTQAVGDPSDSTSVTVTNTGFDPLELTEFGFGGSDPGSFELTGSTCHGASLAHDDSCTLSFRFSPTSAGGKTASLEIGHNGSGSPSLVTLSGIGLAPVASPSTTELDFDAVTQGDTSDPETVTITNTGTANLVIGTTSISGPGAESFDVTDDDCAGTTIAPASSCDISVTFTAGDSGEAAASLSVTHNTTASPTVIALTGNSAPTSDIKILGIGSAYTGHDHLVTRTVKTSGTLMKYKLGIVNEDTVAHTYKFDLTPSGAAATAQVWATGFPAQALPTDGSGNFVTGTVLPGKTALYELRVTPTAPGQVTAAVDVDLLSATDDLIESVSTETNTAAPVNGPSGFELFAGQGSQPLIGGPVSGQTVTSPALNVGQTTTFKLRLKNNSATPKQIGLRLTQTDGCTDSFTVTVKSGAAVITTAAFAGTYLSPSLAAGKYKDIVVSIKRAGAACPTVHLEAASLNGDATVRTSNLVTNASYNAALD